MAILIEELVHPHLYEFPFSQSDVKDFAVYSSCPSCDSPEKPNHLVSLGHSTWSQCVKVVQCVDCQLLYYWNPPGEEFIANFYQNIWNKSVGEHHRKDKTFKTKRSSRMAHLFSDLGFVKTDKPCLDVGCGTGKLLAGLDEAGFSNLWGTEMSTHRAVLCQSRFPGRVFSGGYKSIPREQRFQVIYSNHVMEHIHYPSDFFSRLAGQLEEDGVIILTVPNAWEESILNQVLFLPHLHSFCGKSLEVLGQKNGFSCLYWKGARWEEITVVYCKRLENLQFKSDRFFHSSEVPMKTQGTQTDRVQNPWKMLAHGRKVYWSLQRPPDNLFFRRHGFASLNRPEVFFARFQNAINGLISKLTFSKIRFSSKSTKSFVSLRYEDSAVKESVPVIGVPGNQAVFHIK